MLGASSDRSLIELQAISQQALASLQERRRFFGFFYSRRTNLFNAIERVVSKVERIDPREFTENTFAEADSVLKQFIETVERHLAQHVASSDTIQCQVLAEALRRVREARRWIAQGLSPDPSKRPSDAERRDRAMKHAATVWADLTS